MVPQTRETIRMGITDMDALGLLDHQGPVFPPLTLVEPYINSLLDLLNVTENTKIEITMAIRLAQNENSRRLKA